MIRWLIHNKRKQGLESLGDASSFGCDASPCCLHHDIVGHEAGPQQLARGGCEAHARQAWTRSRPGCPDGGGHGVSSSTARRGTNSSTADTRMQSVRGRVRLNRVWIVSHGLGSRPIKRTARPVTCDLSVVSQYVCVSVRTETGRGHRK